MITYILRVKTLRRFYWLRFDSFLWRIDCIGRYFLNLMQLYANTQNLQQDGKNSVTFASSYYYFIYFFFFTHIDCHPNVLSWLVNMVKMNCMMVIVKIKMISKCFCVNNSPMIVNLVMTRRKLNSKKEINYLFWSYCPLVSEQLLF